MTLEEAIQHLKDSIADPTHKWGCEECKQEHIQLLVWLESYKTISESYPEVCKKIDRPEEENMRLLGSALRSGNRCEAFESENRELKWLLRLAVEDIVKLKNCEKYPFCGGCPKESEPLCKWKHHDEAMKLLGGADNAET